MIDQEEDSDFAAGIGQVPATNATDVAIMAAEEAAEDDESEDVMDEVDFAAGDVPATNATDGAIEEEEEIATVNNVKESGASEKKVDWVKELEMFLQTFYGALSVGALSGLLVVLLAVAIGKDKLI